MNYISSIVNEAPGKFMVCKSPVEDFNDGSILTVNPGEQSIFVNCGQVIGIFSNGRYELTTQNYPFINAFRRFLANGQLTYHCSVFFVSETQSTEVLWGLSLPVRDPVQGIYTKVFARGSYILRINDGGKLLGTLLGMNVNFMSASDCKFFFGNKFQQQITNALANYISHSGREVLELCADNISVAEEIAPKLSALISDSGLEIGNFCISAMEIDSNDPNRRILEAAYAKRRELDILGENYGTIKDTDVRLNASRTSFAGMTIGTPNPIPAPSAYRTSAAIPNGANSNAASANNAPSESYFEKLQQLNQMLTSGLISQAEYDSVKSNILSKMV